MMVPMKKSEKKLLISDVRVRHFRTFLKKYVMKSKQGVCKKLKLIPLYEEEKVISENFKSVF